MHARKFRNAAVALIVLAAVACASDPQPSRGTPTTKDDSGSITIGDPVDSGDLPDPDSGELVRPGDAGPEDANVDGAATGEIPCTATKAFVPSTGATGTVCNASLILAGNTSGAGLDYSNATQVAGLLDGKNVTSCFGATFDAALSRVVVRAFAVAKACDTACIGAFCGTGRSAYVFFGDGTVYKFAASIALTATPADFILTAPPAFVASRVVVCRAGYGSARDDVKVDRLNQGYCKPGG